MRRRIIVSLAVALTVAGCSSGEGRVESEPVREAPPVRGEIDVAVEPLALDALPAAPEAGTGQALLGEETYSFVVTFCDDTRPIGEGQGDGVQVNWDIHEDGDHRVNIRTSDDDGNWVRGGPAEAQWDEATRTLRFAGAFVPFRATDGSQAQPGGVVLVCPPASGQSIDTVGGEGA